jgi:hypothetical protein
MLARLDRLVTGERIGLGADPTERASAARHPRERAGEVAFEGAVLCAGQRHLVVPSPAGLPRVGLDLHGERELDLRVADGGALHPPGMNGDVVVAGDAPDAIPSVAESRRLDQQRGFARIIDLLGIEQRPLQGELDLEVGQFVFQPGPGESRRGGQEHQGGEDRQGGCGDPRGGMFHHEIAGDGRGSGGPVSTAIVPAQTLPDHYPRAPAEVQCHRNGQKPFPMVGRHGQLGPDQKERTAPAPGI